MFRLIFHDGVMLQGKNSRQSKKAWNYLFFYDQNNILLHEGYIFL